MIIKNAKIFVGKNFTEGDIKFEKNIIMIGKTEERGDLDAHGSYLIPGLVDIHTHGAVGEDFSDGKADGLVKLGNYYASRGVTSFLATTMTLPEATLKRAMETVRDYKRGNGAKCGGVHLEGPFLCYSKRGAQAAENLHRPDVSLFQRLNEASGNQIKLVTVAPEVEGAMEFIEKVSKVCTVSLGHTAADYDTALAAFKAGATHATHLFNAMPPLLHRAPGVIGAALDSGASAELICDGLHIHPSVIRASYKIFGEKLNLISDSLRCAGMPDGDYELGGQPIVVKDGKATLLDGTIAGSSISLMDAVGNCKKFGIPLETAVYAATTAPARAVKLKAGEIKVGLPSDLVMLDDKLKIEAVFIDGNRII